MPPQGGRRWLEVLAAAPAPPPGSRRLACSLRGDVTGRDGLLVFCRCKSLTLLEVRCEACAGLTSNTMSDASVPGNTQPAFCEGAILREFLLG